MQNRVKYVSSETNPADAEEKGAFFKDLETHELWWKGPSWLNEPEENWPMWEHQLIPNDNSPGTRKSEGEDPIPAR